MSNERERVNERYLVTFLREATGSKLTLEMRVDYHHTHFSVPNLAESFGRIERLEGWTPVIVEFKGKVKQ